MVGYLRFNNIISIHFLAFLRLFSDHEFVFAEFKPSLLCEFPRDNDNITMDYENSSQPTGILPISWAFMSHFTYKRFLGNVLFWILKSITHIMGKGSYDDDMVESVRTPGGELDSKRLEDEYLEAEKGKMNTLQVCLLAFA